MTRRNRVTGAVLPFLFLTALLSGCLRFGPDAETGKPTEEQVQLCRELLGIDPGLEITPLGYKAVYGIDDAVWFKFSCETEKADRILQRPEKTPILHGEGLGNLAFPGGPSWWDVGNKGTTWSESWTDPDGRWCLSWTALTEGEESVVYVFWHEL